MRLLALTALFLLMIPGVSFADDVYTVTIKKQEQKKAKRWSLDQWFETKEKMRLMDMWLALNSPSPFEFFLAGDYQSAGTSGVGTYLGAYASIVGLELQREWISPPRTTALFHLRIFGYHDQSTHITLQGGLRDENQPGVAPRAPLAGVRMSVYLLRYFGVEGLFRRYFSAGGRAPSNRYEAGAFIDFKFVRVYGKFFSERDLFVDHVGSAIGTKIYF